MFENALFGIKVQTEHIISETEFHIQSGQTVFKCTHKQQVLKFQGNYGQYESQAGHRFVYWQVSSLAELNEANKIIHIRTEM